MKQYNKIPKYLRREYAKEIRRRIPATIKAFFIFPYLYVRRHNYFKMGLVKDNLHLKPSNNYWLVDNSEHIDGDTKKPLDFIACWYGDLGWRESIGFDYYKASKLKRFLVSLRWVVFRNSVWNLKLRVGYAYKGKIVKDSIIVLYFEGDGLPMTFRNKNIKGISAVTYTVKLDAGGTKELFRYSETIKKGSKWVNRMRGYSTNRAVYKNRRF